MDALYELKSESELRKIFLEVAVQLSVSIIGFPFGNADFEVLIGLSNSSGIVKRVRIFVANCFDSCKL